MAFNDGTKQFIVESAKREMQQTPNSFAKFWCHYVFSSKYDASKNKCDIPPEKCASGLANAVIYERVMSQDLGDFWSHVVVVKYMPSIDDCNTKSIYLGTSHQD